MTMPLVERLRAEDLCPDLRGEPRDFATKLVNPDGPEAADTIEKLAEALERLLAEARDRGGPPSAWLNAALAICWILWLAGKGVKLRVQKTPAEAVAWLHEHYPAIATEAATAAETPKSGSVHEGAGRLRHRPNTAATSIGE